MSSDCLRFLNVAIFEVRLNSSKCMEILHLFYFLSLAASLVFQYLCCVEFLSLIMLIGPKAFLQSFTDLWSCDFILGHRFKLRMLRLWPVALSCYLIKFYGLLSRGLCFYHFLEWKFPWLRYHLKGIRSHIQSGLRMVKHFSFRSDRSCSTLAVECHQSIQVVPRRLQHLARRFHHHIAIFVVLVTVNGQK